ncbi:U3 small nucleolar RNA-associated protein 14 [Quillaja saponaria]|uniref:U3 small nucleolar RNA-associated protein 14 n=1 Tax=Quillaja saponaria TaxID=32244 RepID=A0AAD7Q183_QUISA|nr:U3 small nucleolar RNA-associated protein 14 [Quillaja saponaria]
MGETKRKTRDEGTGGREKSRKKFNKQKPSKFKPQTKKDDKGKKKSGPRLPNSLRKELESLKPSRPLNSDEEIVSDDAGDEGEFYGRDVYEYEEEQAEEESHKNRRYDPVQVNKSEYELPDDLSDGFKDENLLSDDESDDDNGHFDGRNRSEEDSGDEGEEPDEETHKRMLNRIFEDLKGEKREKKKNNIVISEAYPESEYNPTRDVLDGAGQISITDLLDPLHGISGYSKLNKRIRDMEKKSKTVHAPLSKADRTKIETKTANELVKKDIGKWEPHIKRNREAPTIYFDENVDLGFSTVGAIASEFEPRTEFEKKMASLVYDDELMEAYRNDGSRLLELNKVSFEDEKERQNRIAKMRSLLFRHEMKAKHIKKIKSKTYHRLLKKDRSKAASSHIQLDPEAAKEYAMKQERERAEERMTLRHKNSSKWVKRKLERGLEKQDEGTRAAIANQLQRHEVLTRKMNSMKENSSSDDSSGEDDIDENSVGSDQDSASKFLQKAKEKTMKVLEDDDELPKSGLLSLPFMRRELKKKKEAAAEEAKHALQEYESSLKKLDDPDGAASPDIGSVSGRRVFGVAKAQTVVATNKVKSDNFYGSSDSEDDLEVRGNVDVANNSSKDQQKYDKSGSVVIHEDYDIHQDSVFKNLNDKVGDLGPNTTADVSLFVSGAWKKVNSRNEEDFNVGNSSQFIEPVDKNIKETVNELGDDSNSDSEGKMVDGILSSGPEQFYALPSQEELIHQAFAGDDVEDDFEKDKQEILNEENPEPEKPILLPGWGQWTHVQKKKGLPSRMLKEHENAKRKREEVLSKRKDAHLKHVIVSEKLDKKAEKLHTRTLPYPFTSQEVFEQSIRMPIGPEFNPVTAIGALNRPEVMKKPGIIIKPIEYEEVNPHEITDERSGPKHRSKRGKNSDGNTLKKIKARVKS